MAGTSKNQKSAYPRRNNIITEKGKGLLHQKPRGDVPESNEGSHVIEHMFRFWDRYFAKPNRDTLDAVMENHYRKREPV